MTAATPPQIGDLLRAARVDLRFTQDAFSAELGISRRTLLRWEGGYTRLTPHEFARIATTVYRFDPLVGERVARELGVASPAPPATEIEAPIAEAARSLGVTPARLRGHLGSLVAAWRARGCTLEQIDAAIATKKG